MSLNRVDHIGFTVSDLDRSTQWYREHLGFQPLTRYARSDLGAEVQVLRHDDLGIRLSLRRFEAGDTEPFNEMRIGLDHIALQVSNGAEIARWQAQLERKGVRCDRTDLPQLTILVFRDPDNIQIELCTPLSDSN
jgi:catechol 2,3-dioxygenase-like lactoylglutathione lyase family enzyme